MGNADLVGGSADGNGNGEHEDDEEGRGGGAPVHRDGADGETRSVRRRGEARRGGGGISEEWRPGWEGGQPAGRPACGVGMAEELKKRGGDGPTGSCRRRALPTGPEQKFQPRLRK